MELNEKYKAIDKTTVKIDLVDFNTAEKVSITSKGDLYGMQYLTEKQPYEINIVTISNNKYVTLR